MLLEQRQRFFVKQTEQSTECEEKRKNKYAVITGLLNETLNVIRVFFFADLVLSNLMKKKDVHTQSQSHLQRFLRSFRFAAFNI